MIRTVHYRYPILVLVLTIAIFPCQPSHRLWGQEAQPGLTVDRIFGKQEFAAKSFGGKWLDGERAFCMLESSPDLPGGQDIVRIDAVTGDKETLVSAARLIPEGEEKPLKIERYEFTAGRARVLIFTNSKRVWRQRTRGDYWVLDRTSGQLTRLGGDAPAASLMFATPSPDGESVAYVRDRNIHIQDLNTLAIRQLTSDTSPNIINGTFDWVYEEELGLRNGMRWSPSGKRIAFWKIDTTGVPKYSLVDYTSGLYPVIHEFAYPKSGEQNPACSVHVVGVADGQIHDVAIPGDPRQHYLARIHWTPGGERLLVQQLNRLQNTNRVYLADFADPPRLLLEDRDDAWVDVHDELYWSADGEQFSWISERSGWRRAYLVDLSTGMSRPLARAAMDMIELLRVDTQAGQAYFIASPDNAAQRYLYSVGLDGQNLRRLSPADQPGTHTYSFCGDGQLAVHSYSSFDRPPLIELISLPEHTVIRTLQDNKELQDKLAQLKREPVEFFRVPLPDGPQVDGWCVKPPGWDSTKKYPVLIYVYGEPAGQTVLDVWGGSRALWHRMLAERGVIVVSFDNRGTPAPRGRDWRKAVYRQVGILAPQDQANALRAFLKERPYADTQRVAIWGWSGGGSMTLNALFKFPDLYQAGISIAAVPNQRLYDTIYQERYMGLPQDNVRGYRQGSSLYFAQQLKGKLLLIHGTGDDNVHYQGAEALVNALIHHRKQFSMLSYPNRTHAIREGHNTTLHLRDAMTRFVMQHLLQAAGE